MKHLKSEIKYGTEETTCSFDYPSRITGHIKRASDFHPNGLNYVLRVTNNQPGQPKQVYTFKQRFVSKDVAFCFFLDHAHEVTPDTPIERDVFINEVQRFIGNQISTDQSRFAAECFLDSIATITMIKRFGLKLGSIQWCLAIFNDESMSQIQALALIRIVQSVRSYISGRDYSDHKTFASKITSLLERFISGDECVVIKFLKSRTLITHDGSEWYFTSIEYDPVFSPSCTIKGCKYAVLSEENWKKEKSLKEKFASFHQFIRKPPFSKGVTFDNHKTLIGDTYRSGESRKAVNVRPAGMHSDTFAYLSGNYPGLYPEPNTGKVRGSVRSDYTTDLQTAIVEINDPNNRGEKALIIPGERVTKGVTVTPSWYVLCIFPAEDGDAIFRFARDVADALQTYDKLRPAPTKQETKQQEQTTTSPNTLRDAIVDNARVLLRLLTAPVSYTVIRMSNTRFQNATNLILMSQTGATLTEPIGWSYIAKYCGDDFKSLLGAAFHCCDIIATHEVNYRDLIPQLVQHLNRLTTENFKD